MNACRTWRVRLIATAIDDYEGILRWTTERFGEVQATLYAETIDLAIKALGSGPDVPGIVNRSLIAPGLLTLHIARQGRKGRHLLIVRVISSESREIEVLRILHDSMDLSRHLPEE